MIELLPLADPNLPAAVRRRFLPYLPHSLEPRLPIEPVRILVDDHDVTEEARLDARCRVRPWVVPDWHRVTAEFRLPAVDDAVRRLAWPDGTAAAPSLRHLLRIRCPSTRLRRAVRFEPHADGSGSTARFTLLRDDVDGTVHLEAATVRDDAAEQAAAQRANERFAWLARSPRWYMEVGEGHGPHGGAFDMAWVDFADPKPAAPYRGEEAASLRAAPDALSHVVIRPEGPMVLVNARHPELVDVLRAKGTHGLRARVRDVLLGRIGSESWRIILVAAGEACIPDAAPRDPFDPDAAEDDWADLGDEHWVTRVLRHAAKTGKRDFEELLGGLADPARRDGLLLELSERLGAVGKQALQKLAQEVAK